MHAIAGLLGVPFEDRRKLSTWSNEPHLAGLVLHDDRT